MGAMLSNGHTCMALSMDLVVVSTPHIKPPKILVPFLPGYTSDHTMINTGHARYPRLPQARVHNYYGQ